MDASTMWVVFWLVALGASLFIADAASGGRASWGWGLLGPVGWVVAGLRGIQIRLDAAAAPATAPASESVECAKCGARLIGYPDPNSEMACVNCENVRPGYSATPPRR